MKKIYFGLALALLVLAILVGVQAQTLAFEPVTVQKIVDVLTPLFVTALFLERAQEVFVSAWREPGKRELEVKGHAAAAELAKYQAKTQRIAFLFGFAVSAFVAIVGVRALEHLVMLPELGDPQQTLFKVVDVLLTAAIIGGGSDGIHTMVSVITDSLDVTREKVQAAAPSKQKKD